MRKIAVLNQKGGVGKTTTVANVSAALAEAGHRVMVIDLDPQAHLTIHLGSDSNNESPGIYEVLTDHAGNGVVRNGSVRSSGASAHALVFLYVGDRLADFVDSLIDVHADFLFVVFHASYSCQHSASCLP